MEKNKLSYEIRGNELELNRIFDAHREKVFLAFARCELIEQWWGPRTWPVSYCKMDFREGGTWHYCMKGPEQEDESWGRVDYKEIREPEFIAYVDSFSDEQGKVNHELPSSLISYSFTEKDGKTHLTSTARYEKEEDLQKVLQMGMVDGIAETFDRLEELVEKISD